MALTRAFIPPPLHSYTGGVPFAEVHPGTLGRVLAELDRRWPGLRFRVIDEQDRIRPHIRFFVAGRTAGDLGAEVRDGEDVLLVCALSGG